ncbi:hypothetical protein [Streptomyces sp. FH025]|uniref:hypothetical protein n=1 Tax=Streptomyces sp. FH025 TaxID=2815937 RepID=UPI001A9D4735|nr:hypothetical protein [Streptomyces sp. FH025]MBO1415672.1 hypothetical protein [Streptomyces sp. FH025]
MADTQNSTPAHLPDEGLARRAKALACAARLQALDDNKGSLRWVDASVYQMAEIALHTIDQVTVSMDFDSGASQERILDQVQRFVALQAPVRAATEHQNVARHVLQRLINVGTVDRSFSQTYGSVDGSGVYRRFTFEFNLLVERADLDGRIYLRATDEAINVLVGALDTDVESAQIAAEVKLGSLIRRGRLAEAKLAAEQARYRTVQYGEMLRQLLDATRRNVRAVDWDHEVPELLADALAHIEERYDFEHRILTNISEARDKSDDPLQKQRAAELVVIVRDCIRRHMQLQKRLLTAGELFRKEQDRQQFAEPPRRAALDLHGQLLVPLLGLPVRDASRVGTGFFRDASGPAAPAVLGLASLVTRLLRSAPERQRLGDEVPEPILDGAGEQPPFSLEDWAATDELLELHDAPRTLSDLLMAAEAIAPSTATLLLHRAVHAFSPELGQHIEQGDTEVLLAVRSGGQLDLPRFGGDDLLLQTASISEPFVGSGPDQGDDSAKEAR